MIIAQDMRIVKCQAQDPCIRFLQHPAGRRCRDMDRGFWRPQTEAALAQERDDDGLLATAITQDGHDQNTW